MAARKLATARAYPEAGTVSYLHCPTCQCAYNVVREVACPRCGIRTGKPTHPTDEIITATDALLRAIARATPEQVTAAEAALDDLQPRAVGSGLIPTRDLVAPGGRVLRAVRASLAPPPGPDGHPDGHRALLTTVALALLARVATRPVPRMPRIHGWAARARRFVARATA
ncbi:MAG: hypothetical protein WKG01_42280 [Kofleriaceae bacterium]